MTRRLHRHAQRRVGEPGGDEGRHALDRGQPADRHREGQRPAVRRAAGRAASSSSSSAAVVAGLRGASPRTSFATRSRARDVDALTDDEHALRVRRHVDADEARDAALDVRAGEEDQVLGLLGEPPQQPVAEPEVLHAGRPRRTPARVRVPSASRAATSAWGSGATVSTTGMPSSAATSAATIDPTSAIRRCSTSTRPAARRTRRMPRRASTRRGHAVAAPGGGSPKRDAHVVVARPSQVVPESRSSAARSASSDVTCRPVARAARTGDDPLDPAPLPQQGVPEVHEQGGDAAGVALAGVAQAGVHVTVEEELDDGEAVATGAASAPAGCSSADLRAVGEGRASATGASGPPDLGHGGRGRLGRPTASGAARHPGSARRSPRAASAAARTTAASAVVARDPGEQRGCRPARGPGPIVSTRRARAAGSALGVEGGVQRGAVHGIRHRNRPRLEGALREHPREASLGAAPHQRRRLPRGCGRTPPRASTACSATSGRSSSSRATRWTGRPRRCPGRRAHARRRPR